MYNNNQNIDGFALRSSKNSKRVCQDPSDRKLFSLAKPHCTNYQAIKVCHEV